MRNWKLLWGCVLCVMSGAASAQEAASKFVGTWELQSIESRNEAGAWVPRVMPGGGRPVGILMYDDKGHMSVQITTVPRTAETNGEWVDGYVAYYATYEVDANARSVTHHRQNHVNPELGNLSVVRYYEFSGDTLTLTVAPEQNRRLRWVKVH